MPEPVPACEEGAYVSMRAAAGEVGDMKFVLFETPKNKAETPKIITAGRGEDPLNDSTLHRVRYISTNLQSKFPETVWTWTGKDRDPRMLAQSIGMLSLATTGLIDEEMKAASEVIEAVVGVATPNMSFVSLHVRTGGSAYNNSDGQRVKAADWDGGFHLQTPDMLLHAARNIPRDTVCTRPLYIARFVHIVYRLCNIALVTATFYLQLENPTDKLTRNLLFLFNTISSSIFSVTFKSDSHGYRTELQNTLPRGVMGLSCCAAPLHIDTFFAKTANIQHLVDIMAFFKSIEVFRTGGGYASVGQVALRWAPVPSQTLHRDCNASEALIYLKNILSEMDCKRSNSV